MKTCMMFFVFETSNFIGDEGVRMISEALKSNNTLAELDLGCNFFLKNSFKKLVKKQNTLSI